MDVPDEGTLDVDILADDGSEDEGEAPPSSGPASTPTSCASSPRGEEPASPHGMLPQVAFFHHQPYSRPFFTSSRRGPGRPRKEGVKLTREGKIVRRYRATPGSVRGAKRHRSSRDDILDDLLDDEDFAMPVSEEPPYFPEKWPGKLCALCNLGERSQLGQGEMRQINCSVPDGEANSTIPGSGGTTPTNILTPTSTPSTPLLPGLSSPPPELLDAQIHPLAMPVSRRQKGINKCKTPYYNLEHTDELSIIGHIESLEITGIVSNGAFYIHRCCLEFSPPFQNQVALGSSGDDKEGLEEARVKGIVTAALQRKCAFCTRHGASIPCNFSCSKYFHLPCVLASGGFQDFQTKSSFCKDHVYQVTLVCAADIDCRTCRVVGDIGNLMTCVTCGAHYHGTCVGLAQLPGVRAGWSCRSCRVCHVCRLEVAPGTSPAESRAVTCEHCDKQYHATCLRPMMATVPKYGWKCKCCRVCSDCGARSPGAGPSSRWHAHYTVCDSCYQQRNKGSCCPLCRRAYRAAAQRDMIRCTLCKRYVHGMCDPDADPQQYKLKKEQNQAYEYVCPICKPNLQMAAIKSSSFEDEGTQTPSRDSFSEDIIQEQDPLALEIKTDIGLGKGKPYTVSSKVAKKKMSGYKMKGSFVAAGKLGFQKRQRTSFLDFGRKRGAKPKMRGVFGVPGLGLQRPQAPDHKTSEDDPGVENKLVLCSSKDKFVLTQDLCVMCGAIGTDSEGCLIACSQCGQTYHPYCVSIKVSKVIVTLGWRCLDCTVCEGCGQRSDDALLVLCDDCDTAWHTYCARPQLAEVPRGSWRCERCRRCQTCGTVDTQTWSESYTECAPCASLVMCCVCSEPYSDGELIIQCEPCQRWLHATCDSIRTENDAEICCRAGYHCILCRGRDVLPPHLAKAIECAPVPPVRVPQPAPQSLCLGGEYYVDDICLSQHGAAYMKDLETRMGITHTRRKRRFKNEHSDKDAVVQNVDTDMGNDDSKPDSTAEVKEEPGIANPNYKEGTLWNVANDGPPPEGFTIYTTESGLTVLRRKRQRNLNKLGIGGFVVRQRQATIRAQADEDKDGDSVHASGESPSNKRKPRRKPRSKLMEQFPSYMQEAFFGKDLLEPTKIITSTANPLESPGGCPLLRPMTPEGLRELRDFKMDFENSDSDGEDVVAALTAFDESDTTVMITLKDDEIDLLKTLKPKDERDDNVIGSSCIIDGTRIKTEAGLEDGQLKHTEDSTALKNAILGPAQGTDGTHEPTPLPEAIPTVHTTKTEPLSSETGGSSAASTISPKDELSLLGVSLDAMVRDSLPDMDGADVDEIFKGVLTDDSQESQESSVSYVNSMASTPYSQQRQQLASPMEYASPYHTEYGSGSNSQLSPAFSEGGGGSSSGGGPWASSDTSTPAPPPTYNQRSTDKMRTDESLGSKATISAVLYANTNHPEWKTEFPVWVDRCKQILKKWRALPGDQKAPYLQRARDNRSEIRMKKAQQNSGAGAVPTAAAAPSATSSAATVEDNSAVASSAPSSGASAGAGSVTVGSAVASVTSGANVPEQERACGQQRSAREAEQERQWKQLQQLRQQQTQQQQQIIHDQRIQAMQRLRTPDGNGDGTPVLPAHEPGAPRSAFPAQRFPLHYGNSEDINRQLRDLLQRHPEKMWPPQGQSDEGGMPVVNVEGQPFRQPLPVGARPRPPLLSGQRPDHHLLMQQRLAVEQRGLPPGCSIGPSQTNTGQRTGDPNQVNASSDDDKSNTGIGNSDAAGDEMDMGDMDKLEQDTGNIAEVGDILTGLGADDDEELLESLTAEIGEEFNILSYADPELSAFNDAEHILDGLDLADEPVERHAKREPEDEAEQKIDNKMDSELQKAVKNIENAASAQNKIEIKSELDDTKIEGHETKAMESMQAGNVVRHIYTEAGVQRVITHNQLSMQGSIQTVKTEVKLENEEGKASEEWRGVQCTPQRTVFGQMFSQQGIVSTQIPLQQGMVQRPTQFLSGGPQVMGQQLVQRPQVQFAASQHAMHFQQGAGNAGIVTQGLVAGQVRRTRLVAPDGHQRPATLGVGGVTRPPPPPPYPGTLRQPQPPPPPYPQEQPLLLEELLEQEKREQERDGGGEWVGGAGQGCSGPTGPPAPPVVAPPSVPLYAGSPPAAPPPPPDRIATDTDRHAQLVYEQWLQQYNAFATDQLRYYDAEVQKLRKIRKSLNSKQRQLRKSGNELTPTDAAELRRVSTEQAALQKHLEAARKQARQHSMLIQEYETKHRQQNPQIVQQQSPMNQQQMSSNQTVFAQNQTMNSQLQQQNTINRPMQIGLQNTAVQQTLVRAQQSLLNADGQQTISAQGRTLGTIVTSPMQAQGRILQSGRTLVIEQTGTPQPQLVRQLSGVTQERPTVSGMVSQFGQQQLGAVRNALPTGNSGVRTQGTRPAMSPLHVQSPHSQSPLHSIAPQSPLHHLTSPMQSPLHSQQSPLHHTSHSPLHPSTHSPLHTQQSPLHSQQSPMHVQQNSSLPQQSPMHPQHSPMHPQQSPMHPQQSPMHPQQSPMHMQQSPMHSQQSQMHPQQSPMHPQQSPIHPQQSPMHPQQSPMHPQHSPMHPQQSPHSQQSQITTQQSPMHSQQLPMHSQQSPLHLQQSPMHTQQSSMQSSMSPQHFLQQLQAQRTSPQLPTPSRSPQIYQQSQILSPVASHSPQMQNAEYSSSRFPRPASGCSPLPTRFARPPHHQQGMRVGVTSFGGRQTSPLGSPQPLQSPGNPSNDAIARQQMLQRQQYSPMGGAPASPMSRSPHVARTPTPSASPAASPAPSSLEHGGGGHHGHHIAPIPPGYRYFKVGLFGGAPVWPNKHDDDARRRSPHINKVSILKRRTPPRPRFPGKTAAPGTSESDRIEEISNSPRVSPNETREFVLYSSDSVDYTAIPDDSTRMTYGSKEDDDDIEEIVEEHLDDSDIVVVEPGALSPEEHIATEQDFEELIDGGKPEDESAEEDTMTIEKLTTRTETTTKTVAVISLATAKQHVPNVHQYKIVNPSQNNPLSRLPVLSATMLSPHPNTKILNEVSQATVASVSIANQTISVPVLKSLSVPLGSVAGHSNSGAKSHVKKLPLNMSNPPLSINMTTSPMSKPMSSVISVISSNMNVSKVATLSPVITLATSNTAATSRLPLSILTQQVKQKIVKTIEKPMALSLPNSKLSGLSVNHDITLPAKIFQDEVASPDSTVISENNLVKDQLKLQGNEFQMLDQKLGLRIKELRKQDIDIESEISQQTELPHSLCISDRAPLLMGKTDIKSPDPIPEKIPDNIMEGDDEDKPDENMPSNTIESLAKNNSELVVTGSNRNEETSKGDNSVVKTIKAIANQNKDMVIDSNMQISSEVTQESVQISIPSPTPSQEQYLNTITMQEHGETGETNQKRVDTIEDMLCILENIPGDAKLYGVKQHLKHFPKGPSGTPNMNTTIPSNRSDNKDKQEQVPSFFKSRETNRISLQSATVPQLSPLSQPAELTTNMANVSQQLRTIMSSINTSKVDSSSLATVMRKNSDTTPTQVNFENLLPSSKVEVVGPRSSSIQRQMDKQALHSNPDNIPMSAVQAFGSRVNTLSMGQSRKSPNVSPISSPVGMQPTSIKSPAQSPLITNLGSHSNTDDITNVTSVSSQIIQMPALSKIHSTSSGTGTASIIHTNNTMTTTIGTFQKSQMIPTSILGNTLLQPARQLNPNTISYSSQSISSSQPPALVMTSRPTMGAKIENTSIVTARTHGIASTGISQGQISKQASALNFITSSTLLHTQLTSPLKRSKSTDEPKSEVIVGHIQPTKRHSVESVIVKSEPMETDDLNTSSNSDSSGSKMTATQPNQRNDESQNVLLKQLLQTTTTSATVVPSRPMTIPRAAPALGSIPSLEAQLARPSIPPPTLSLPQEVELPKNSPRQISSRDSPFNPRSIQTSLPTSSMSPSLIHTTTQSLMDVRKPAVKVINKEETIPLPETSPTMKPMPLYSMNSMSIDQQQIQTIKKEVAPPQQSPVHRPFTPLDVKKELLDESSQQSATSGISTASDQGKLDHAIKEDFPESVNMDSNSETVVPETPTEAKKRKRREYQQKKRKQMQLNMKAAAENSLNASNTKKRPRKGSRFEEDYDTFIDNLMAQLRLLPSMQIQEPALTTNFAVCPLFGSGDLTKLKNKDYDILKGDLVGEFGNARIPNVADYYNTKPFGEDEPLPEKPSTSTQRGFYDQEFQPITFDDDPEDKKTDFICKERDTDTPDSIVSCSSPECLEIEPPNRFPGLKLIGDEDEDEDSDSAISGRVSPIIPIISPVPLRVKPVSLYLAKEDDDSQKSLKFIDTDSPLKPKVDSPGNTENNENVTVTLTLTSGAAEDILGVLKELAGILHIPPPTSYQIVERTATPPSHKLGLYRSKGRDGKEGTPIDIQSILNGAAKFCRHCDVVILDSVVRAKASEFPLLTSNKANGEDILCDSDTELYFCSTQCYKRFAWRPTNIILDGKSKTSIKDDKSDVDTNLSKDRDDFDTASTESMETDDLDIKPDIKDEKMDLSFMDSLDNDELMKEVGDDVSALDEDLKSVDDKTNDSAEKEKFRGFRYKAWAPGCIGPPVRYKRPTDRELTELVFRTGVAIMPVTSDDSRKCELCGIQGDGVADGVSRLLNCDVDRWVHLNCALWSDGVYETVSGALMNVETALAAGTNATCAACRRLGATVRCFKVRCGSVYHLGCAVKENCVFHKNKTTYCSSHAPKGEKDNELTTLSVQRRVYVSRDEQRQVASVMLHSDTNHLIRVGGLIFLSPGHLLPHQLAAFHTPNYIYPVGYKIVRFYWSMRRANSRCRYVCWISDEESRPRFHVQPQDENKEEIAAPTARAAWAKVLDAVAALRNGRGETGVLKLWPDYVTGEDLFGLTEPAVVRVLESLPGIETLTDYRFKFGRSALLEGGLAVNPSGCARSEPRHRATWRRPPRSLVPSTPAFGPSTSTMEPACPYSKQFVHTKSSQYKKMKLEWRNNVYLARSKIQGLGLYAARDIEKHTMVIEYIGEIIRSELSELREKQYEAKNRGIYMFRLDERRVVDATLSGGLARYINHSCQPNCVAETVEVDRHLRIIIFAKRRISRGEELAYDYKFDIEDDAHKIMCMCGAPNCRKWMN